MRQILKRTPEKDHRRAAGPGHPRRRGAQRAFAGRWSQHHRRQAGPPSGRHDKPRPARAPTSGRRRSAPPGRLPTGRTSDEADPNQQAPAPSPLVAGAAASRRARPRHRSSQAPGPSRPSIPASAAAPAPDRLTRANPARKRGSACTPEQTGGTSRRRSHTCHAPSVIGPAAELRPHPPENHKRRIKGLASPTGRGHLTDHDAPDRPVLHSPADGRRNFRCRAERRLSGVVPVYAEPDQDVCGVDM
jgi:hypothetical protein